MKEQEKALLKEKIDKAKLISFDVFDTLLFRKTNTPEAIFDLVGRHFGIHGFRKLRMDMQNEASRRAYEAFQYPHADMDQIYEVLAEHTEIPVDWMEVKEYEIQMEKDALVANQELLEMFRYAKNQGKRVVATSDMYLFAATLSEILAENGFGDIDHVYCSADEHKAKFNRDLFELVAQKEQLPYEEILHIGDKSRDDGEFPAAYGMDTFVYHRGADLEKVSKAGCSDVDNGLYKILYDENKGFWYNLGVEVGGPLYMGLYRWMKEKTGGQKVYFLSRDGYNLYQLFKKQGFENIEYLYTSRRALTLASIVEMNDRDIANLPPYTFGQTVGEILDYLCVERDAIQHLEETGLKSFEQIITTEQDIVDFKKLYVLDKEVFLERCKTERDNALAYFNKIGFFEQDAICFDCGWQGSSQELLEQFKKAIGCQTKNPFLYFGIKNSEKSRTQLRGMHYDTYLFDFYKNYALQVDLYWYVVMYELFFSAPHESVYYYGENGKVIFESGEGDGEKAEMLDGICDFVAEGLDFVEKYDVEYSPDSSVGHLQRLIHLPTVEEAVTIGNMQNVDGFARKQGESKYIAYVTREQLDNSFKIEEIYWLEGLFKREDVPEDIKKECAAKAGMQYPKVAPIYNLEDGQNIRNYHRWLRKQNKNQEKDIELAYKPKFSVVIPVYNTVTEQLEECFQSVLAQTYDNFELILVDDHSSWPNVVPVLQKYEADERVHVIYRETNGHISVATNQGIGMATGEFIVFMDCDDLIEPHTLYEFAKKLNENPELDFIYSDEDKITEDGKIKHMPFFKPEWSPDLFMSMMYTNHLATYRASIVKAVGGLRTAYNGSQDYDFTLRFMEKSDNKRVGHIPKVLYHWRERKESVAFAMSSKNYATEASRYAKEDFIRRNHLKAHMEYISGMSQYHIVYEVVDNPLVSIIIPSKDHPEVLKQCIDSIQEFTKYQNYEVIVVDNGSNDNNKVLIEQYLASVGAKYIYDKFEFNFSKMCNIGATQAKGEYLLFLNDDIEIFQPEWLERMLGHAQQKHVGAVGAKLFYPQSTRMQHVGVTNLVVGPGHSFMNYDDQAPYYFGLNRVEYNCIGVTGACLLVAESKFREVQGFDEEYPVAYNDVKLCFALHEKGYYNVMRNDAVAYHHESLSRGLDQMNEQKLIRLNKELTRLYAEFKDLQGKDPYINENLYKYEAAVNLKDYNDELMEMDIAGCEEVSNAYVDFFNIGERIQIIGWSMLEQEEHIEELDRYVVFRDPYGRTYGAKTVPYFRPDVADHFGGEERYLYSGYESVLRKSELCVDMLTYQIGIMTIDRSGKRYLQWCGETPITRNERPRPQAAPYQKMESFEMHRVPADILWAVDECQKYDSHYKICGLAHRRGDNHYQYAKKLVLVDQNGRGYEFEVQREERLDVAYTFPNEQFMYYTGFVCYIFDGVLEKGCEYDVVIRFRNQFHAEDILDIETGHKVRG